MRNYVINRITEWFVKIWITRTTVEVEQAKKLAFLIARRRPVESFCGAKDYQGDYKKESLLSFFVVTPGYG